MMKLGRRTKLMSVEITHSVPHFAATGRDTPDGQ